MKLSGSDWKELRDALCDAFPSHRELERLFRDHFGKNIWEITSPAGNLQDVTDDIIRWILARDKISELVGAAFAERPDNASVLKLAQKRDQVPAVPERESLERVLRQANSFIEPEIWYSRFRDIINQVCQIEIRTRSGGIYFGSGVLIAPNIVLTNYHVIECVAEPEKFKREGNDATSSDVTIRFDNKKGTRGYTQPGIEFRLMNDWLVDSSPYHPNDLRGALDWSDPTVSGLDYALLCVDGLPGEQNLAGANGASEAKRGWVTLDQRIRNAVAGMGLVVMQYPQGQALKVGMDTDAVVRLNAAENRIKHRVNTMQGSSGAPCFNFNWDLVAIHQAGVAPTSAEAGYNVAVPISKIITALKENGKADSLGISITQ